MSRARTTFAFVIAAAMSWAAQAQPTTLGTRFQGFTYVSNVIGYVNMTTDYCDMQAAIVAGNFTAALEIYSTGKNSFSGLTRRTFFRFASYASTVGVSEPLHDALTMGRNSTWLDTRIKDAIAQRNGPLTLGLVQVAALKYFLHELDEGHNKIASYLADPENSAVLISDASGAPHNIDEAFALWAGGSPTACATLSSWAARLGSDLEATFLGQSYVNSAMTLALNELLASSQTAKLSFYNETRYMVVRYVTMLGLQGVLRNAYRAHAAVACRRPAAQLAEAQANIAVHWTYLQPLLLWRNVRANTVQSLQEALTASNPNYPRVLTAVKGVLAGLGRRLAELGQPRFDRVTAGWTTCSPAVIVQFARWASPMPGHWVAK